MAKENKTDRETPFSSIYPNTACPDITCWTQSGRGWIELGRDEYRSSTVRVLDIGGLLWEGDDEYDSADEAMAEADNFIRQWRIENGYAPQ
ncbi:hypothetical protein [Salinibacter ruber]|uniref:hypothetical protein n=1 Tax=Salinibacter ruber TaxID=146919 RepID=UPI002167FCF9|nr:hypothetical protein [Salinibacter ruber]MCS3612523.1 hypothetical protein [Salinibacter ruber]MCS3648367.1 hypothetical protein [Salinibacter ruber]MCS3784765.1 hypothetical protein [Salinibacter ruber]